jgi:DNA repair protein RecO (recombination protein O)
MNEKIWHPAYVLHARAYRETSVLADFFLPELGRVTAIARGVRRKGQQIPSAFQPYFIQLAGQGELRAVAALETTSHALALQGAALFSGLYLNELLVRLLPRELPQPELFVAYAGALGALSELVTPDTDAIAPLLRAFERQLLESMGQWASNSVEAESGEPLSPAQYYQYYPEHGWLAAREGQRGACLGEDILAVHAEDLSTPTRLRLAKVLYRSALMPLLGNKPLKSRDLFSALQGSAKPESPS